MRLTCSIDRFVLLLAMGLPLSCSTGSRRPASEPARSASAVVVTPAPAAPHGLDPGDMDPSVPPCGDFYRYADGGWLKKNPSPADYPSWGSFNELDERNREILHQTLEKLAAGASRAGRIRGEEARRLLRELHG